MARVSNGSIFQGGAVPAPVQGPPGRAWSAIRSRCRSSQKISATQKSTSSIDKSGKLAAAVTAMPRRCAEARSTAPSAARGSTTISRPAPGTTENSNDFSGTITAVVTGVLPNGHLLIAGEKQIGVNHNVDVLRFSGQVDPRMIQTGNVVALGADRQRADRAARPRRPGRGPGHGAG